MNAAKFHLLAQPPDATIGTADMMPVWNLKAHANYPLHWDGLNTDPLEVIRVSALAPGATRDWMDADLRVWDASEPQKASSLRRLQRFMTDLALPVSALASIESLPPRVRPCSTPACALSCSWRRIYRQRHSG